jgi:hypothetical protein
MKQIVSNQAYCLKQFHYIVDWLSVLPSDPIIFDDLFPGRSRKEGYYFAGPAHFIQETNLQGH